MKDFDRVDSPPVDIPRLPKNNAVNKFWASVEPYCADITNDDIKFLEDMIKSHEDDSEYFKVDNSNRLVTCICHPMQTN